MLFHMESTSLGPWKNFFLDETALVLSTYTDGFLDEPSSWGGNRPGEKRLVRVVKQEGSGLGISIQGGSENSRPIVIRYKRCFFRGAKCCWLKA